MQTHAKNVVLSATTCNIRSTVQSAVYTAVTQQAGGGDTGTEMLQYCRYQHQY